MIFFSVDDQSSVLQLQSSGMASERGERRNRSLDDAFSSAYVLSKVTAQIEPSSESSD